MLRKVKLKSLNANLIENVNLNNNLSKTFILLKKSIKSLFFVLILINFCNINFEGSEIFAFEINSSKNLKNIKKLIESKLYLEAEEYIKVLVEAKPNNFHAWDLLGVCYFHTGRIDQALKTLKFSELKTPDLARNYLYQGLSYMMLKQYRLTAFYLKKATKIKGNSKFIEIASYEIAIWYFNRKKSFRAQRWINHYINRFPKNPRVDILKKALKAVQASVYGPILKGIDKPNLIKAKYQFSPLSLFSFPHYWYLNSSLGYELETFFKAKNRTVGEKKVSFQSDDSIFYVIDFNSGFGFGPFENNYGSVNIGYDYLQKWDTTDDRFNIYFNDITDFRYFLFRPDLMSRKHSFYLKFRSDPLPNISFGLSALWSLLRSGSHLAGADSWDFSDSININMRGSVSPWFGFSFNKRNIVYVFMNMMRKIDFENPDFSHQNLTYNYVPQGFGVKYISMMPRYFIGFGLEASYHNYLFNDPFLDHKDITLGGSFYLSPISFMDIYVDGSYTWRNFTEERLRLGDCQSKIDDQTQTVSDIALIKKCPHASGLIELKYGIDFTVKRNYGIFLEGVLVQNQSIFLQELSFSQYFIKAGFLMTFPDVAKVKNLIDISEDRELVESIQ